MAISPDFVFIGRLCLDLTLTGDMGYGRRFERLTSTGELQRWLSIGPLRLKAVRVTERDLRQAIALRGAVWRAVTAMVGKAQPPAADVQRINRVARQPGLVRQLDESAQGLHWHHPTAPAALATIAQDAVVLLGDAKERKRVRRCENPRCRTVFYDDSRPGLRRWCASNRCGDRIRAQAYRRRRAERSV